MQDANLHRVRDRELAAELEAALAEMGPGLETARVAEQAAAQELAAAETAMGGWQEQWEVFNQSLRDASSAAGAERASLEVMDNQLRRPHEPARPRDAGTRHVLRGRRCRHAREPRRPGDGGARRTRIGPPAHGRTRRHAAGRKRPRARTGAAAQAARRETQEVEGRIVSLEALQRAALGQGQGKVVDWLKSRGLERSPAWRSSCRWTRAGTARSRRCSAGTSRPCCVDSIDGVAGMLDSLTAGTVTFFRGCRRPGRVGSRRRHAALARARTGRSRRAVRRHRRHRDARRGAPPAPATARGAVRDHARRHLDRPGLAAREPRQGCPRRRDRARRTPACRALALDAQQAKHRTAKRPRSAAQPRARTRGSHCQHQAQVSRSGSST